MLRGVQGRLARLKLEAIASTSFRTRAIATGGKADEKYRESGSWTGAKVGAGAVAAAIGVGLLYNKRERVQEAVKSRYVGYCVDSYLQVLEEKKRAKEAGRSPASAPVQVPSDATEAAPPSPVAPPSSPPVEASPDPPADASEGVATPTPAVTLPDEVPYLIVGAGTAAFSAFRAIRTQDPTAKVLVIGEEEYLPYMRPPLSKELWFSPDSKLNEELKFKQWNGRTRSLFFEPAPYYCSPEELISRPNGGVAVVTGKKVVKLDATNHVALMDDGQKIKYGRCLLATGGRPRTLDTVDQASEEVRQRVMLFRGVKDYERLEAATNQGPECSVVVIGGGFLGSELACALGKKSLSRNGMSVTQLFPEAGSMGRVLPDYLSRWTMSKIRKENVDVRPNTYIKKMAFEQGRVQLYLNTGNKLAADCVVVAVGLEPVTDLARPSGLETDPVHGGYLVNTELEARTGVWAAGDAACFYDTRLGRRRVEHHDHAVVSGRLAGENMTGAGKPYYHQSMFWSDLGPDIGYEAIGIVDASLPTVAVFAKATEADTPKAAAESTGEGLRSEVAEDAPKVDSIAAKPVGDNYGKGVVFYLRDGVIVGVVCWNLFNKMGIARKLVKDGLKHEDLTEVAKLFNVHGTEE